jgi:3-oxoacyl-[acyl-carrier protein] reductase
MSGRVIIITGGNGAIGLAMARAFLEEAPGNYVWLGVHHSKGQAEQLAQKYPERCSLVEMDVTKPAAWETAVSQVLSRQARLDVLVNNAGKHSDSLLATMPGKDWKEVLEINLHGAFHGCQAVLPTMISQRCGRIINIASLSAILAPAGQTNYAAAKAGLVAMTQSLAKEVARINITVNAVCPGYVETEALAALSQEERQAACAKVPMRRFGRPEEVAAAVRFLACPEASYITGSIVKVDGGIF